MRTVHFNRRRLFYLAPCLLASFMLLITVVSFLSDWGKWRHDLAVRLRQGMPREGDSSVADSQELPFRIVVVGRDTANRAEEGGGAAGKGHSHLLTATQTGECRIPALQVDRPEVMRFYTRAGQRITLDCRTESGNKSENWLRLDDSRRLQPTDYGRNVVGVDRMRCRLRHFDRLTDSKVEWGRWEEVKVGSTQVTRGDFLRVKCQGETGEKEGSSKGGERWSALFMTAVRNESRAKALKEVRSKAKLKKRADWSGLNVYVLGFDSLSQMAFRRNMPRTVDYLESTLGAVVLNGLNIVGDGTPQAFIPFLTGKTEVELPLTRKRYKKANYVDDVYPFVWANFSAAGYVTAYAEDSYRIGTFSYRLKGFRHQPTDHFGHTFFSQAEKEKGCCACLGAGPMHKVWLDYAKRFWKEYEDTPRFMLMHHAALSHDSIDAIQAADEDLRSHLEEQFVSGAFSKALVIIMADHGHRFAQLRETHQGQLEERLPFFAVYFPKELRNDEKYKLAYENLVKNGKDRLMTHFDIHPTLLSLLHWPSGEELARVHDPTASRGLSLFREIPLSRTCEQAGIEPHWCTCLAWEPVERSNAATFSTAEQMAQAVVQVINEETEPERRLCSPLTLHRLIDAKRLVPNDKLLAYNGIRDKDGFKPKLKGNTTASMVSWQLLLETEPGGAKYEATLLHDMDGAKVVVDLTAISHINAYGDRPHCIIDKNYFLATYCVCYDRV